MIDTVFPHSWAVDLLRGIGIFLGGVLIVYTVFIGKHWWRRSGESSGRYRSIAFVAFALLAVIQEAEQIGEPFVVWRLPLLITGTLAAIVAIMHENDFAANPPKFSPPQDDRPFVDPFSGRYE